MSKKTENIYKAITNLNQLQEKVESFGQLFDFNSSERQEMDDIQFQMKQELKSLKFWIDSLYSYNGKSKSHAKQASSRENGKKGGRPPKEITAGRRRLTELEDTLIPELEHKLRMTDDLEQVNFMNEELQKLQNERIYIEEKLSNWNQNKK